MEDIMNGKWKDALTDWKSMASMYAALTLLRGAVRDLVPPEVYQAAKSSYSYFFSKVQPKFLTIHIQQYENDYDDNSIFKAAECYLSTKCYTSSSELLRLSKIKNAKNHTYAMVPKQVIKDFFNGVQFRWTLLENDETKRYKSARGFYLEVSFESKYKEIVDSTYLPHITKEAEVFQFRNREKTLYTNRYGDGWSQVCLFSHPSTFDTIAIDPSLKKEIQDDLNKFVSRSEFYTRVGKAWKRGYLLYGPPGTGKTSLIAAIANHLEFDVYDMELTSVSRNEDLRELLINTSSKSIIVVEDIDCSIHIDNRKKKNKRRRNNDSNSVSLSGVLNFVDGLWSPCAGERLIIFTTNHKEKLDPALLRSGRMDKHILLSYCNMESFKVLAKNYLKLEEHELMKEIEELLGLVEITPADVAECLMSYDEDPDMGMRNVVGQLKKRLHTKNNKNKEKDTKKKLGSDIKEKQKAKKKKGRKNKRQELDDSDESDKSESSDESDQSNSSDDANNSDESTGSDDSDSYETAESDDGSNELLHFTDETMMAIINMMMI
ncbi:AAA-ATPase At3g50940-like [Papaver somniferum]|uniref:AAA-ATPase At3g50940-like n=1 Tax=Papaver somniferum TaxID=3469 RepID=UPI000E6F4E50|nr:AAA-ATPase At3g50940-like [Papaver somniferum]